jgi:hypothetical protein
MFRRRPIRRAMRPLRGRARRSAPQALITANQMLESGNYQEAAERFEAIAQTAESRGGPRAPQFYLQAGRARLLAGHDEAGLTHLKHGLSLFTDRGEWLHLRRTGRRVVSELNDRGLADFAEEITAWLNDVMPADSQRFSDAAPTKKPTLPTHCPSCGGALRPDEVDWLDETTAECAYCGSPVREDS